MIEARLSTAVDDLELLGQNYSDAQAEISSLTYLRDTDLSTALDGVSADLVDANSFLVNLLESAESTLVASISDSAASFSADRARLTASGQQLANAGQLINSQILDHNNFGTIVRADGDIGRHAVASAAGQDKSPEWFGFIEAL